MEHLVNDELKQWKESHSAIILQTITSFFEDKTSYLDLYKNDLTNLLHDLYTAYENAGTTREALITENARYNKQLLALTEKLCAFLVQTDQDKLSTELFNLIKTLQPTEPFLIRKELMQLLPINQFSKINVLRRAFAHNSRILAWKTKQKFKAKSSNKEKPAVYMRDRIIPFQEMLHSSIHEVYFQQVTTLIPAYLNITAELVKKIWTFDNQLDELIIASLLQEKSDGTLHTQLAAAIQELESQFNQRIKQIHETIAEKSKALFDENLHELDQSMLLVQTPFLSITDFQKNQKKKHTEQIEAVSKKQTHEWLNTIHSMFDDWNTDIQFGLLFYNVYEAFHQATKQLDQDYLSPITQLFEEATSLLQTLQQDIARGTIRNKKPGDFLQLNQTTINDKLKNEILQKAHLKLEACKKFDFGILQEVCKRAMDALQQKHRYYADKNTLQPIKDSAIHWIIPADLLAYTAVPGLEKAIAAYTSSAEKTLHQIKQQLIKSTEVAQFNLETAMMMLSEGKVEAEQALQMASDGFNRTMSYLEQADSSLQAFRLHELEKLEKAIHTFNSDIEKLRDSSNLNQLNLQIARVKTIEKSKQLKKQTFAQLKQKLTDAYRKTTVLIRQTTAYVFRMQVQLGIQAEKKTIGYDLSHFIANAEHKLNSLPLVYQRLFQFSKGHETRFFVGRESESDQLAKAYAGWQNGSFSLTSLIGDKGTGKSALVQHFVAEQNIDLKLTQIELKDKITNSTHLCQWLSNQLLQQECDRFDELIQLLNEIPKSIIFIKNAQHLFLKTVGGFDALQYFLDFLYKTARQHFFIISFTPVSFNFLDHTLKISDAFTNVIKLEKPTQNMLEELILLRHGLSGFNLHFEEKTNPKHFLAMYHPKRLLKQTEAQTIFFRELLQHSNGNISLALMHWLHQIEITEGNLMKVSPLSDPHMEYIHELDNDPVFSLHLMILHDGLSEEDFIRLSGKDPYEAKITILFLKEKGLIIQRSSKYTINPVVYPTVTNMLQSRNLIY